VAAKAGVTNDRWGFGVAIGDYDNDGWPDIAVANYGKNRLYHNNHDGTFTDVAEKAGILWELVGGRRPGATMTATAAWISSSPAIFTSIATICRSAAARWWAMRQCKFRGVDWDVRPARTCRASRIISFTTTATGHLPM
jgi:hypothetical protein